LRRAILGIMVVITGAGCAGVPHMGDGDLGPVAGLITIERSPSPFSEITAGPVRALVPDGWEPFPDSYGAREGFFASPTPEAWPRMDGFTEGIAATWVDATVVGVPSDFYYLAATGPLFSQLIHSAACRADSRRVFVDNLPAFASGRAGSTCDFMARGEGTCHEGDRVTRWAYFVAAPGFGPVRQLGIARSGLYVVVAVLRDGRQAGRMLKHLIGETRFGGARIGDFVRAVSGRTV
jgi:hypothetical protein